MGLARLPRPESCSGARAGLGWDPKPGWCQGATVGTGGLAPWLGGGAVTQCPPAWWLCEEGTQLCPLGAATLPYQQGWELPSNV